MTTYGPNSFTASIARVGAVIGGLAMELIVVAAGDNCSSANPYETGRRSRSEQLLGGTGAGVVIGGDIGSLVGLRVLELWKNVKLT